MIQSVVSASSHASPELINIDIQDYGFLKFDAVVINK
jgi:hypothetical protein